MRYLAGQELADDLPEFAYADLSVGQTFPPFEYALSEDDIRTYVVATRDDNPIYRDAAAARAAGLSALAAPPTVTGIVGLLKAAIGAKWPDSTLHLRQTFVFHGYPLAGERLTLRLRVDHKEERKGRRYYTLAGETTGEDGRPITGLQGTFLYGFQVTAGTRAAVDARPPEATPPAADWTLERAVSQDLITRYAHASAGRAGIHIDPEFARRAGHASTIAHAMLTVTFLDQVLARGLGPEWHRRGTLAATFLAPVRPGDTVTAAARRDSETDFDTWGSTQAGHRVIAGHATLL